MCVSLLAWGGQRTPVGLVSALHAALHVCVSLGWVSVRLCAGCAAPLFGAEWEVWKWEVGPPGDQRAGCALGSEMYAAQDVGRPQNGSWAWGLGVFLGIGWGVRLRVPSAQVGELSFLLGMDRGFGRGGAPATAYGDPAV